MRARRSQHAPGQDQDSTGEKDQNSADPEQDKIEGFPDKGRIEEENPWQVGHQQENDAACRTSASRIRPGAGAPGPLSFAIDKEGE